MFWEMHGPVILPCCLLGTNGQSVARSMFPNLRGRLWLYLQRLGEMPAIGFRVSVAGSAFAG